MWVESNHTNKAVLHGQVLGKKADVSPSGSDEMGIQCPVSTTEIHGKS